MKKLKIIIPIVIIILTITFGVLGNTTTAKAANNECSADYTKKTYMNKINYTFSGNTLSFTGAQGLLYSTSLDSSRKAANADGTITINVPNNKLSDRIEVYFYLANDDGTCPANKEIGSNTIYASASSRNNLYDNDQTRVISEAVSNNVTVRKVKKFNLPDYLKSCLIPQNSIKETDSFSKIFSGINSGNCALFVDTLPIAFDIEVKGFSQRSV